VHDLFLGTLATEGTGPAIHLSSLQLFDLATALDEYTADVVGLPREQGSNWLKQPPLWAKTVAVVAGTLAVAIAGLKLVERHYAQMAAPAGCVGRFCAQVAEGWGNAPDAADAARGSGV
jgi:hypothetical protein